MGFDIQRFVETNIEEEFICNICQDVLENPLMIIKCEHLYCSNCIRDCIRVHGVCPQDRSPVAINKLAEPVRVVKNLLNKLKIRCNFGDCEQVMSLGELNNHLEKCEFNPENQKLYCFCKKEFPLFEFTAHKDICIDYHKNELKITTTQLLTYSMTVLSFNEKLSVKMGSDSEIKFLYNQLKQSMSKFSEDYTPIQRSLLYICSKLLLYESENEKDLLSTNRSVKYAFEDLWIATNRNYDNCCQLISNNVLDYMFLCNNSLNNRHINKFMAKILKNISQFEDLIIELMNKKCIKVMLNLMNEKNDINTCIESATVLSHIILMGTELWDQQMPDYNRQQLLTDFKANLFKWKFNQTIDLEFDSFKELFTEMASDKCTPEVMAFYIWLLTHFTKTNPQKYFPLIESENGFAFLKGLAEDPLFESQSGTNLQLILNKGMEWKDNFQKVLPENKV